MRAWMAGAAVALAPMAAAAQTFPQAFRDVYVSGEGGVGFPQSLRSAQSTTKIEADPGGLGSLALGWRVRPAFRVELQTDYGSDGVDHILTRRVNGLLEPLAGPEGDARRYDVTANLIYDLPVRGPLRPYVGVGAGYGWLDLGDAGGAGFATLRLPQQNTFTGPVSVRFGSAGAFAYKAFGGAALPVRQVRGLSLTAEYRFSGMARADVPVSRTATGGVLVNGATPTGRTRNGFAPTENGVLLGARYAFGPG